MKKVLDYLISQAPDENDGAAQVQVTVGAVGYAGAIKKSSVGDDIYEMLTVGQTPQQQPVMVTIYIKASAITSVQMMNSEEPSSLLIPKDRGGIKMPGLF